MVWPAIISGVAGLIGGALSRNSSRDAGDRNAQLQREFAQQGIRWKVEDAKAAGIHPLYALGASTSMASPAYVGSSAMGEAVANMGQDLSRAAAAGQTQSERGDRLGDFISQQLSAQDARDQLKIAQTRQSILFDQDTERKRLENELLRLRLAREASAQLGPGGGALSGSDGISTVGGGSLVTLPDGRVGTASSRSVAPSDAVMVKPSEVMSSRLGNRGLEAGSTPGEKEYLIGRHGRSIVAPNAELSETMENMGVLGQAQYWWHKAMNEFDEWKAGPRQPPNVRLPPNYFWKWNPTADYGHGRWQVQEQRRGR